MQSKVGKGYLAAAEEAALSVARSPEGQASAKEAYLGVVLRVSEGKLLVRHEQRRL